MLGAVVPTRLRRVYKEPRKRSTWRFAGNARLDGPAHRASTSAGAGGGGTTLLALFAVISLGV